jgi:hypothetical protein
MQRTSKVPKKPPRRPPDEVRGLELAKRKSKIRNQREEINKLKRSIKLKDLAIEAKDLVIGRLNSANNYLSMTAKSEGE